MSDDIKVTKRKITDYKSDPNNANKGTERGAQVLDDSIAEVGAGRSLVADKDGHIVAGNKTREAAERAGITEVIEVETDGDAIIVHKRRDWDLLSEDDKRARLYAYFDNRAGQLGLEWSADQIAADVEAGIDLGTMFDPSELAFLIGNDAVYGDENETSSSAERNPPEENIGAELQAKWNVEAGQVWAIPSRHGGLHKIACGDSTDSYVVACLFESDKAQIAFTSPPYAEQRKNANTGNDYGGIPEDKYVTWWDGVQSATQLFLELGGSFFVNIKPHSREGERALYVFDMVLAMQRQWGWKFVDEFCWRRHTAPGRWLNRLKNGFEPVYQFQNGDGGVFVPDRMGYRSEDVMQAGHEAKHMKSTGDYYNVSDVTAPGVALPDNVIEAFGVRSGIAHSAMYPVGLPFFFMQIFSNRGDIIYDPFLGSGTNIHAAEKAHRLSYGVELMPEHVAIMLEEWTLEGYVPELVG